MRSRLLFFLSIFIVAIFGILIPYFVPLPALRPGLVLPLQALFGALGLAPVLLFLFSPVERDARLGELGILGKHGLRKTDINSFTYFVDHPTLADGSPNTKLLRFFFESEGKEIETVLLLARVRIQVLEHKSAASVEFCFHDDQKGRCSKRAALTRNPLWWFAESRVAETGFMYALLVLSPEEFKQEVYLKSGIQHF